MWTMKTQILSAHIKEASYLRIDWSNPLGNVLQASKWLKDNKNSLVYDLFNFLHTLK